MAGSGDTRFGFGGSDGNANVVVKGRGRTSFVMKAKAISKIENAATPHERAKERAKAVLDEDITGLEIT